MNRERYMACKRHFSQAVGAAAALEVTARHSPSSVAAREAATLREALRELERLVDESRDEARRGEPPLRGVTP